MKRYNRLEHFIIFTYLLFTLAITATASNARSDKKLKVGISQNTPTLSFIEQNEEMPKGFSVDLAKILADSMDLEAQIYTMSDSDLINALNEGKIDVAIGIMDDSYSTVNSIQTSVQVNRSYYINRRCSTFTSTKDLPGHIIAIEEGRTLSWLLSSQTDMNFIHTNSQEEALTLVDSGEAQVYISKDSAATQYIIDEKGFRNIKQVGIPIEIVHLVLAVNKNNPELLSSLSIAYGKILEDGSYHRIFYKWLGSDLRMIMAKYRTHIIITVLFTIFAFFIFIIWNFILKREVNKITKDLQVSEQKYRDLIESSPDMIHLISLGGEIRLANRIALKNLGYNEKEMISLRLHDLLLPEQADDMTDFVERAFIDKYSNKEFTLIAKNGTRINVEMAATILKGADSSENLACCFSRDLRERKRLEEELIYSDRLAVMGRMAAGIAHEINSPLWVILSNAEDALSNQLSQDELQECLESIERNGVRAAKSIEDMLTFARPVPMKFDTIDLIRLIEDSLIFLKQKLKEKNIRVEKKYPFKSIFLHGDENSIQQLLINIILNAIQALNSDGSIVISVNVTEKSGSREIVLEISDNGKGIPDEELQYIFNPYFTSGKTKGFGLGLFMAKMIVEKHHGIISARSQLEKGTVMTVYFHEKTEKKSGL